MKISKRKMKKFFKFLLLLILIVGCLYVGGMISFNEKINGIVENIAHKDSESDSNADDNSINSNNNSSHNNSSDSESKDDYMVEILPGIIIDSRCGLDLAFENTANKERAVFVQTTFKNGKYCDLTDCLKLCKDFFGPDFNPADYIFHYHNELIIDVTNAFFSLKVIKSINKSKIRNFGFKNI